MNRMMAIVEREMRKFFRSPALMLASMIFPLVQLIILGNAFGGKIRDARMAIVDQDGGTQALKIREAFDSVRSNIRTFVPIYYDDEKKSRRGCAQRKAARRGHHSPAVFAPRVRTEPSAHRAGGG
jgi:ABC-2 type transport system permease protein